MYDEDNSDERSSARRVTDELIWKAFSRAKIGNFVRGKEDTLRLTRGMDARYLRNFLREIQPSNYFEGKWMTVTPRRRTGNKERYVKNRMQALMAKRRAVEIMNSLHRKNIKE